MLGGRAPFFSGVGGSGMSALALFCAAGGLAVRGSDRSFDQWPGHPLKTVLEAGGVEIVPQDGSGVKGSDRVIASTAVEEDRPDIRAARALGLGLTRRPDLLGGLLGAGRGIAVAGTSGKSTTAGMLAFVLKSLGYSPSFLGGAAVKAFRTTANPGNMLAGSSDLLVAEACEADPALAGYRPWVTIVGNLALDHRPIEETAVLFRSLADNTRGRTAINGDDPGLGAVVGPGSLTFGLGKERDLPGEDVSRDGMGMRFTCRGISFRIGLPGRHNVLNALAVLSALDILGIPLESAVAPLAAFDGLVGRFDVRFAGSGGALVAYDYAHNPHKIRALFDAVAGIARGASVGYVFQPHGFGPTRLMRNEYAETFRSLPGPADRCYLLPIFDAGGTARRDISSADLARDVGENAVFVETREEIIDRAGSHPVWIVFGARDGTLGDLADGLARVMREAEDERI